MTDRDLRFCPRCGAALIAGMPFCAKCGFNSADIGDPPAPPVIERVDPPVASSPIASSPIDRVDAPAASPRRDAPVATETRPVGIVRSTALRFLDRGPRATPIVVSALIVAAGLVIFGLLMRPQPGVAPAGVPGGVAPGGSAAAPSALIVGLTIESPRDGQIVASKDITVIGLAPPGLSVTRDVSLGLDQHATADGTGHWAINVGLDQGENKLTFRIGDDRSTEQQIHVTFKP
jgi:hypothetical protein